MTRDEAVKYAFAELDQALYDALHALMEKVDARARAEEREACAKACEDAMSGANELMDVAREMCAAAIRARGEKP